MVKHSVHSIGEFGLIEQIKKWIPSARKIVRGIGEDTAVFPSAGQGSYELLTIDTIVEEVDFILRMVKPEAIGRKALAINLSDIAAMGGSPKFAVVSLTLPKKTKVEFVKRFYAGLSKLAKHFGVAVVGGDLSRGLKVSSSIALLGEVKKNQAVFRNGARFGDFVCVTGKLGGSILGKQFTFTPRIYEGKLIARSGASAMIDISDGLEQDAGHLAENSKVGFFLDKRQIPISAAAMKLARGNPKKALFHALSDGEDFELLFTISPSKFKTLARAWKTRFQIPLTVIGRVVSQKEVPRTFRKKLGFQHF